MIGLSILENRGTLFFMEKREKKQFDFRQILLLVGMVVAFYIVFDLSGKISAANEKVRERDQMSTRVVGYQQTQYYLETQIAYATQPAFIETYIRPEGHMVKPGDIPIIPLPGGTVQPTLQTVEAAQPTSVANWQIWWELFFGER